MPNMKSVTPPASVRRHQSVATIPQTLGRGARRRHRQVPDLSIALPSANPPLARHPTNPGHPDKVD